MRKIKILAVILVITLVIVGCGVNESSSVNEVHLNTKTILPIMTAEQTTEGVTEPVTKEPTTEEPTTQDFKVCYEKVSQHIS